MRILSLLPAATEIIYLLGLEDQLVGVSHECDYPLEAKKLPKITSSPITNRLSSLEIDQKVKNLTHRGSSVFHINNNKLKELRPNLIISQELCQICAIPWTQVKKAAKILDSDTKIISLEPESIEDILENILLVGETTDKRKESRKLVENLKKRLQNITSRLANSTRSKNKSLPRVLIIEWLNPLMVAGHWVPEMVEKAGGMNLITKSEQKSYPITLDQIVKSSPDVLIFAPCGFNIKRTLKEKNLIKKIIVHLKLDIENWKFFLMDGSAYLTRPGPRIIDGIEILSEILYPDLFPRKHPYAAWQRLNSGA